MGFSGPWSDYSKFENSLMHIKNKDDLSYLKFMKGWYLEIYKSEKFLSSSIIVVFPNDGTESDKGEHSTKLHNVLNLIFLDLKLT